MSETPILENEECLLESSSTITPVDGDWWHLDTDMRASVEHTGSIKATLIVPPATDKHDDDNNNDVVDRNDSNRNSDDDAHVTNCGDDALGEGWRLLQEDDDYSVCFDQLGWREVVMNKTHSKLSSLYNLLRNQPGQGNDKNLFVDEKNRISIHTIVFIFSSDFKYIT